MSEGRINLGTADKFNGQVVLFKMPSPHSPSGTGCCASLSLSVSNTDTLRSYGVTHCQNMWLTHYGLGLNRLFCTLKPTLQLDTSGPIVTLLRAGRSAGRIPAQKRAFSLLQNVQTWSGATQPPIQWITGLFPEDKAPGE